MKIGFIGFGKLGQPCGEVIAERGHDVVEVNSDQPEAYGFDLVHVFNCRVQDSLEQQISRCRQARVPVIISPIWVSIEPCTLLVS